MLAEKKRQERERQEMRTVGFQVEMVEQGMKALKEGVEKAYLEAV